MKLLSPFPCGQVFFHSGSRVWIVVALSYLLCMESIRTDPLSESRIIYFPFVWIKKWILTMESSTVLNFSHWKDSILDQESCASNQKGFVCIICMYKYFQFSAPKRIWDSYVHCFMVSHHFEPVFVPSVFSGMQYKCNNWEHCCIISRFYISRREWMKTIRIIQFDLFQELWKIFEPSTPTNTAEIWQKLIF